jgi:hypothetical protein
MKPGGRGLIVTTDWDAVIWHSDNAKRMACMQASWENHCAHGRLPRYLAPSLVRAGLKVDRVSAYPQIDTTWSDDGYSKHLAGFMRAHAEGSGAVPDDEITAWYDELPALSDDGRYFFALSSFNFEVSR